jgi:hypothetical protein
MKIRHAYGNTYEVTDTDGLIVWKRGTWRECKKYMEKEKKKRDEQTK